MDIMTLDILQPLWFKEEERPLFLDGSKSEDEFHGLS